MAYTDHAWLWVSGESNTLYIQIDDETDDVDQVVFTWRNGCQVQAKLRSSREVLTDCELLSIDKTGCIVDIGGRHINFHWEEPSYERPGLIAEGVTEVKSTTWAQRRQIKTVKGQW